MNLFCNFYISGQVGNVITNRNATRLEFEKILVSDIWSKIGI